MAYAHYHSEVDEFEQAELAYQRMLKGNPPGDAIHNYGVFLCRQKRYAEAIADFSKAIEINPSDTADVYARRAASYEVMGNEGQAARDRAKAKERGFKP